MADLLGLDVTKAGHFDAVVCGAYKWLMSPRGSAFLTISDRLLERAVPPGAGNSGLMACRAPDRSPASRARWRSG